MNNATQQGGDERPIILSLMKDIPNIVTLLGLSSGVLGIYFALAGNFPAAIIAMLWAVLFDWYDGTVARRIPGRSNLLKSIGAKMDSLVDIVSLAVCPAIILLSYGDFSPWFFPGALAIVMAGVVRLAYFDTFGADKDGTIGRTIAGHYTTRCGVGVLAGGRTGSQCLCGSPLHHNTGPVVPARRALPDA